MKIKAIGSIIEWDGSRMVILNPGDEDTVDDVFGQTQVDAGKAVAISAGSRTHLPQLDHDGDGAPGGSTGEDVVTGEAAGFVLTEIGGGWWSIAGPGLDKPEKVRTAAAAEARLAELVAEHDAGGSTGEDGDDDDIGGAPGE